MVARGARYASIDAAVRAGLAAVNPRSIASNTEYAFFVFPDGDGFRLGPLRLGEPDSYTNSALDDPTTLQPAPVAIAHTHGANVQNRNGCASCINTERFSTLDKAFARKFALPIYVATPAGVLGYYDPTTERSRYEDHAMPTHE